MDTAYIINNPFANGKEKKVPETVVDINLDETKGDKKVKNKCFGDELRDFGDKTTHHGFSYVADPQNHIIRRLFWAVLILAADAYLTFMIVISFLQYLDYDVNTVVGVSYVSDLNFPAVTICNYNQYRKSQLQPEELALITDIFGIEAQIFGKPVDWSKHERLFDTPEAVNDFQDSVFGYAHLINETVFQCTWRGAERCGPRNFTTTVTDSGICFTFNDPVNKSEILKINQPGRQNGLFVRMDVQQTEYISSETAAAGFKVLLHQQGVRPLLKELGFSISPGFETSVSVSYTQVENLGRPYRNCATQAQSKQLKHSKIYTLPLCLHFCKVNYVTENCGCRDFRYPGDARVCNPREQVECIYFYEAKYVEQNITCNCTEPCEAEKYDARTSFAYFPNQEVMNQIKFLLNETEDHVRKNYLDLYIFFEELSFNRVVQKAAYPLPTLISDIGGTMGLMVGMSLMTIVEVFDFHLVWLWKRLCISERPKKLPV